MTAHSLHKQRASKRLLIAILVAQLAALVLRISTKFVTYLFYKQDIELSTLQSIANTIDVLALITSVVTCILFFVWRRMVPTSDKPHVTMLSLALLIPTIMQCVITLSIFVPSLQEAIWNMEGINTIHSAIFWMGFAILTLALYNLSRTEMTGRVKKGLKSLYAYCKKYLIAAFLGPICVAIGFIIIVFPYVDNLEGVFDHIVDYTGTYLSSGSIAGLFDQYYNYLVYSAAFDVDTPFSFGSINFDMVEDLLDSVEPNIVIGVTVALIGALISIISYLLSVIFYYRGFILMAMPETKAEKSAQVAETVDEVIETEIE